jgi:hypothetical protein
LLGSFESRNNDHGGYWALGQMSSLAKDLGVTEVIIQLVPTQRRNAQPLLAGLEERYTVLLHKLLPAFGAGVGDIVSATIGTSFAVAGEKAATVPQNTRGDPFQCEVILVDTRLRSHSAVSLGRCGTHDPKRERQRRLCAA